MKISVKLMTMVLNTVNAKKVGKVITVPLQLAKNLIIVATVETVLQVKMVNKSVSVKMAGLEHSVRKNVPVVVMELAIMVNVPVTTVS